jgi:(E)-4-hydroxy-3-methylbut-2-enyl-diphosphate synthase
MKKLIVNVGNVTIGQGGIVVVQTMCNTPTTDIEASFRQCVELSNAGAQIIRLTTQGLKEVSALKVIKEKLRAQGILTPLVADVHFSYEVAHEAAKIADKVRINPGNFAKEHDVAVREFARLTDICKEHSTAVRIGVNHGSLGNRIVEKYGNTPSGMKEAAMEWIKMAEDNNFDQIIISLKASNTIVMTEAYSLLYDEMLKNGVIYPLHLGVTEAGNGDEGRIKSAVGLSALLSKGIGDTIRVSLTESPLNEIPAADFIAKFFKKSDRYIAVSEKIKNGDLNFQYNTATWDDFILEATCEIGPHLLEKRLDDFSIDALVAGQEVSAHLIDNFKDNLMQAARRRFSKPEYIACPGCGRTLFNLESVFNEVKRRTAHLKGYNIAVMGCIVNGPGEMADADYGYVGEGRGKVSIYRGKTPVFRSVPESDAIDILLELIESDARNRVSPPQNG